MAGLRARQTLETVAAAALTLRPDRWPLQRALADAVARPGLALHLPAHRRGHWRPFQRPRLPWAWDLPELPSIGGPLLEEGAVADSQRLLAASLGVVRSWYGVNGASGLLQAALLALPTQKPRVLLPRHLHRSLLYGCVLADLRPLIYTPPLDRHTGLWQAMPPAQLDQLLERSGPVDLLVLLSPTYQGVASQLDELVTIAHRRGVPVLVDEAHGGHFGLAPAVPPGAIAAGADLVVQSVHKSLGGLGQSAALHLQGERIDLERLQQALEWLQTSSPSALLLLSCEQAFAQRLQPSGRRQLSGWLHQAAQLRQRLLSQGLPMLAVDDPLRLVLHTAPLGCSGAAADAWLLEHGVAAECPELLTLTFCLGLGNSRGLARRLGRALAQMRQALGGEPLAPLDPAPLPPLAELTLPLADVWRLPSEDLPLAAAAGRIAARPICPYPPGIPLLVPGERLDPERLEWLQCQRQLWGEQIADTVRVLA